MIILGVDPGLGGALAIYNPDAAPEAHPFVYDIPRDVDMGVDAFALAGIVERIKLKHSGIQAVVENVSSRPRQAGAFAFGLYTGIVHGVLAANAIHFSLIAPSQWKPAMGLGKLVDESYSENKTRARMLARQLFPGIADQFKRVRDDGRAEALLMAVYYANRK